MNSRAQTQRRASKDHPVAGAVRSVNGRKVVQPASRPTSRGSSSLAQSSSFASLKRPIDKPPCTLRRSKSDSDTQTLLQTSLLSLSQHASQPIFTHDVPPWSQKCSETQSEFELIHTVSQILAQKKGLESDLSALSSTISREREIVLRLWNINPSLPIDSLIRLLLLSQEKAERSARLNAIEQAQIDLRRRLTLIEDRESYLDSHERILPSTPEACRNAFMTRRAGLRRERTQLEAELKLRERQELDLRGDIQNLDDEEASYWLRLERMFSNSNPSYSQARRPTLKDPITLRSESALRVSTFFDNLTELDIAGVEETEPRASQLDIIPEIPDSPRTSISFVDTPEFSISVDQAPADGPTTSLIADLQWRQSSSSNANSSSGVDSSIGSPQTPRTAVHEATGDESSIIIVSGMGVQPEGNSYDTMWKFPSNRDSTASARTRDLNIRPSSDDFRKTIHFPSFSIPPLITPKDTFETDINLLRSSGYSIIPSPLSASELNPEGADQSSQVRSTTLDPVTSRTQPIARRKPLQHKLRPTSEIPTEQRATPNWGILKNLLGGPRRLRRPKGGNAGAQETNSSGVLDDE
ncbi:uncharacterized protein EI90DRAFT_3122995 [Cantharellus anzutake]|uniref:uncharacterized protein n=1 Tax=Cantharellus anzutake TaxID=1750568 RepID=UPI00190305E2|nr:uncharacterized protein EI90DRAFT_3122995 [Cantharellus anzutake]KAF8331881.1 hypothetical protein EI90DRAFT_3122995 [Cantharellus anzutake]